MNWVNHLMLFHKFVNLVYVCLKRRQLHFLICFCVQLIAKYCAGWSSVCLYACTCAHVCMYVCAWICYSVLHAKSQPASFAPKFTLSHCREESYKHWRLSLLEDNIE